MHLLAIDLETTGLDSQTDQILEIGAVATDLFTGQRHEYRMLVEHSAYQGQAVALAMNSKILKEIGDHQRAAEKGKSYGLFMKTVDCVADSLRAWVQELPFFEQVEKFTPTGKNVGSFDLAFLKMLPGWGRAAKSMKLGHRCLDPGPLYYRPFHDRVMPDLNECLLRAGIDRKVQHTALQDCHDVLDVIACSAKRSTHLKTGNFYELMTTQAIDATNARNGDRVAVYLDRDGNWYVRDKKEFDDKFSY